MALIECPECSHEISDKAESCPHCGLPLSKTRQVRTDFSKIVSNTSNTSNTSESNFIVFSAITSIVVASVVGAITNSYVIAIFTFTIMLFAMLRTNYLAKHIDKRLKYERHLYSWKGILVFVAIIFMIVSINNSINGYVDKSNEQQEIKKKSEICRLHLSQAKSLLAKTPNLSDDEWLIVRNHLTSISYDAPEYAESQKLLPNVTKYTDQIIKQRLDKQITETKLKESIEKKRQFEQETASLNAKGKRLKAKHPDWSVDDCDTISRGKIRLGMTTEQVAASWGRPYQINRTHGAYGTHEQWVMHEMGGSYVYFENGICTTIQN